MTLAYVGLGSNVGDRAAMLRAALAELAHDGTIVSVSSVYETAPWGRVDQPDFLNCCAGVETRLDPTAFLHDLLEIEAHLGRIRGDRWGPRTIDLDLLLFDDAAVRTPELVVPHPRLTERAFVLVPLAEIAPDARIAPDATTVREALARLHREPDDVRLVAPPLPRPDTAP